MCSGLYPALGVLWGVREAQIIWKKQQFPTSFQNLQSVSSHMFPYSQRAASRTGLQDEGPLRSRTVGAGCPPLWGGSVPAPEAHDTRVPSGDRGSTCIRALTVLGLPTSPPQNYACHACGAFTAKQKDNVFPSPNEISSQCSRMPKNAKPDTATGTTHRSITAGS